MTKYENQTCEVCGLKFDKDDDIVVCPDCGTPHHRHCWMDNGHCINAGKHGTDYEWKPEVKEIPAGAVVCPDCGTQLAAGTLFCENCGKPVNRQQPSQAYTTPGGGRIEVHTIPPYGMGFNSPALAGEIDEVPVKDIAAYIGPNAHYYLQKFRKLEKNKKAITINFTAFFFRPIWFLYRKMWKMAIFAAIVNFVTSAPAALTIAVSEGMLASSYLFPGIETLASVGFILNTIANFIFAILAVPMYKKNVIESLKKMRAESGADNNLYYTKLISQRGPSKIGTVVIFFFSLYFIFIMLFQY